MAQAVRLNMAGQMPSRRVMRHPQHPFQVRTRPWQIAPFFIAPVLPGETMKNLLFQSRVVTDPIKSKLVGWWSEYYFYYVKLRDLNGRDTFTQMMLDPTTSLAGFNQAALVEYYHGTGSISWVKECLQRVVEWDFREDGDAWNSFTIGSLPAAKIAKTKTWLDSAENHTDHAVLGDVVVNPAASDLTYDEIEKARYQYEFMRLQGATNISFEDYLRSAGVRQAEEEAHSPELVRYVMDWQYPSSHIDPTNGNATSAISWKITERADKDRFFKEPGFLFGVTVKRPKVYLKNQVGSATDLLVDLYGWLPPVMIDNAISTLRKVNATTAPLNINTDAYWVDMRDLFMYGEQFVNFALTATDAGIVAVPTAGLEKRYASATDADGLFVSIAPANQVREDGIVGLSIATNIQDTSPTTPGA